jgi:hypothetical protein
VPKVIESDLQTLENAKVGEVWRFITGSGEWDDGQNWKVEKRTLDVIQMVTCDNDLIETNSHSGPVNILTMREWNARAWLQIFSPAREFTCPSCHSTYNDENDYLCEKCR